MCQLFAINASEPVTANRLLGEFFNLANEHPHGWGVADLSSGQPGIARSAVRADTDPLAKQLLAKPLLLESAIAHIRRATIGQVDLANCHPFSATDLSGRTWTLAHKGTVFEHAPSAHFFYNQDGSTDSERILLYLLERLNQATARKSAPLEAEERFAVFSYLAAELSFGNCVNLLVHDSDMLYVYRNYKAAMHKLDIENGVLFCSSELSLALSLTAVESSWQPVPLRTPQAWRKGRLAIQGESCGQSYVDNELDTRYLYWDYSAL